MEQQRVAPSGILGFPVAPMDQNGTIDLKAFEKIIQFQVDEGLNAIFVACGAGEFHALNTQEYEDMVEVAISTVKGSVPVYTGVGGNITDAVKQAQLSEKLGANGYLIMPPYLIIPESKGIYNYLEAVVGSTNLNAMIYHRDNCVLNVQTMQLLVEQYPQIIALKDGIGDMDFNIELTRTIGDRLAYVNGMPLAEVTMPAYYNIGFQSYSSAISNYIPHISSIFFKALKENNQELLTELYRDVILPINRVRKQRRGYAVALIKAGMQIVGLPVGETVRPPVIPVEKEHYAQLEKIITVAFDKYPKMSKKVTI